LPADSYVVQDASSQATGRWLDAQPGQRWWDCCSGAGGKSLLLADQCPGVQLTVSDSRRSILRNLEERFRLYGHRIPTMAVADATDPYEIAEVAGGNLYDRILCDVPCTGSGTWARTPEQLYFFDTATIADFADRQKTILNNVSRYLAPGGKLFYITCSVFAQENEDVATTSPLKVTGMQLINGTVQQADSMFIAVLQRG
jgi:16S rRNA (cytosine967-C5)-methyltransferase